MTQAVDIRDAALTILQDIAPFNTFATVRKVSQPPLEEQDLPALSVFVMDEEAVPFGDGNTGQIKFYTDAQIGFEVVRAFGDKPADLELQMNADVDLIKNTLFNHVTFTKMGPDALFESIEKWRKHWFQPPEGEAYSMILQFEVTFRYQEWFAPIITDDLQIVHVDSSYPQGEKDAQGNDRVQQVHTEYDIPTS